MKKPSRRERYNLTNLSTKTLLDWEVDLVLLKRYNSFSVNHAGFDDVKKNLLDNDHRHQKGGECECKNTWFWWCQRIIKQGCIQDYFNKHSKVKHCFKINTRLLQQISIASRLIQDQALAQNKVFPRHPRPW